MAFKGLHTIFDEIVTNLQLPASYTATHPSFMHEKEKKAFNVLQEQKTDKYPLVLLLHPYTEKRTGFGDYAVDFRIAIITYTEQHYYSDDRYTNNFDTILTPIYNALLDGICAHHNISQSIKRKIEHDKIDNLYIDGNPLPDKLDAIIIEFKNIVVCNSNICGVQPVSTHYNLTISTGTGGTIQPVDGTYSYLKNTVVPIVAIANNGYRFLNWVINGVQDVKNLTTATMSQAVTAIANFEFLGIFFEKLKTFTTAPVNRGNWYFGDYSGNDNDSEVGSVRVGTFTTASYIATYLYLVGSQPITFNIKFKLFASGQRTLFACDDAAGSTAGKGLFIQVQNASNLLRFTTIGDGGSLANLDFHTLVPNTFYDLTFTWNGLVGGNVIMTVNGVSITRVALKQWTGNSRLRCTIGLANLSINNYVSYAKLTNYFEYTINHGQGATIYDISGNNNHGTVVGAVLSTFWGSTSNEAEPYEHTIGSTLYRNTTDNSIMPVCGDNNLTISGFTRIGYFPPASGALKGLPNTYTLVGNSEVPAGDYTADQIAAFVNSDLVQVTQNDNAITQLILKQ